MKKWIFIWLVIFIKITTYAQTYTQTIRGSIVDSDNNMPLIGVNVIILNDEIMNGTTSDENGNYRIENIPIGRANIQFSYLGYEEKTIPNVVINSAKEVILNINLIESTVTMDEVQIVAYEEKGNAINEMALLSSRSISPEQTSRYAGGFNDPSRIVANFAGVANTSDGGNDIIIRGNSPKYMQWRLDDIQITNPNHFGDQSALSGSISTLNNNMLDNSDFYTGAFASQYGNVLSGIYDVRLRAGNNEKTECIFGIGLLGTDLTIEGPFKKGYGGSFIINYRYSTAGIIKDLGLLGEINGVPTFQDASFKFVLPTKKLGTFSIFGLGGLSNFLFEDVKPQDWVTPGDNSLKPQINEDFMKDAHLGNLGMKHSIAITDNSYLKTSLLYSKDGIEDEIIENEYALFEGKPDSTNLLTSRSNFNNKFDKSTFRFNIAYHHKINARHKVEVGSKYDMQGFNAKQSILSNVDQSRITLLDFDENIETVRNYINWKYRISDNLTFIQGFHNMNVLLNDKNTFENRSALSWQINKSTKLNAGYGKHSMMESIHHYFTQFEDEKGNITRPNADLGLIKADHFVLGIEKRLSSNIRFKLETYYQKLYNVPVANNVENNFSTLNESLDFQYVDLVNKGTGRNYGLEITLERFFENDYYYLINLSAFDSKFTPLDGIERDTRFNGKYIANILAGKEFTNLGEKDNQSLTLNMKAFIAGGKPTAPLLRDSEGNLSVDQENSTYYDLSQAYSHRLEDLYEINFSASYKWNKKKTTHELFLNIDNITNNKGKITEYYDVEAEDSVGNLTQFGIFPNLMYRVYF